MAIVSDKQEDQSHPSDQNPNPLRFNFVFDPSNPIGLLESAINFMSSNCDFLRIDSLEEKMVSLVRSAKEGASMDEKAKRKREAEAFVEKFAEGKKRKELVNYPNNRYGFDMEDYSWGQSFLEVTLTVLVPQGTEKRWILCELKGDHLRVGIKGAKPTIEGETFESVKLKYCIWRLVDKRMLLVVMPKIKGKYWKSLLKGGPEIDFQKFKPEPSRFSDLDSETKSGVEKSGLPTIEETKIQEQLEKSNAQSPNKDSSGGKQFI